jgi:hypothetical protein
VHPNFVTYDEAAFERDPNVFKESLFPLVVQRRSVMVLATTPGPPESYFMRLILVTDENGQPKMRLIRLGQACEACMASTTPWACQHMRNIVPKWKSKAREKANEWLWLEDYGKLAQENLAITQDLSRFALGDADNRFLRDSPLQPITCVPPWLVIGVDAALGGEDEYAIIVTYPVNASKVAVSSFGVCESGRFYCCACRFFSMAVCICRIFSSARSCMLLMVQPRYTTAMLDNGSTAGWASIGLPAGVSSSAATRRLAASRLKVAKSADSRCWSCCSFCARRLSALAPSMVIILIWNRCVSMSSTTIS